MEKTIEIPEGYEARIEGNKIILEPKESEDERIRKEIIEGLKLMKEKGSFVFVPSHIDRAIAWLEKQGEQDPAWSDEDEDNLYHINALINDSSLEVRRQEYLSGWLKSIKDRAQPKSEWSEKDEKMLQGAIDSLRRYELSMPSFRVELQMRWLSSLKNRI